MAGELFVDTSGWYALIDRSDFAHPAASGLVRQLLADGARLVSTDYVLDESCTLGKARSGSKAALRLLDVLEQTQALDVERIDAERFARAKKLFRKHHDQEYSFTDCTSFVVMREQRITESITTDDHFRVAGFSALLLAR